MSGLPVTIRLLDPPLHEFLPQTDAEIDEVAASMGVPVENLRRRASELHEFNPILGFRGCRLAVAFSEIAEMQARAIFEAAAIAKKKAGEVVTPEIMVPLVIAKAEFDLVRATIDQTAETVPKETGERTPYMVGAMIELPRRRQAGDLLSRRYVGSA
jgi:pyruvate,orthophosphate dikinase